MEVLSPSLCHPTLIRLFISGLETRGVTLRPTCLRKAVRVERRSLAFCMALKQGRGAHCLICLSCYCAVLIARWCWVAQSHFVQVSLSSMWVLWSSTEAEQWPCSVLCGIVLVSCRFGMRYANAPLLPSQPWHQWRDRTGQSNVTHCLLSE